MGLRILLASHSAGLAAGAERSLLQIARYLNERGVEVSVAVPREGDLSKALHRDGIATVPLGYDWARPATVADATDRSLSALQGISAHLRAYAPDLLVTNTLVIPWFALAANQLGIRHAWFIREDLSNDPGFAYPDVEQALHLIRSTADGVFVPSGYMRDTYRGLLGRDDIRVVYPTFDASIAEWASRRPTSTTCRIVVCATIMPHKNQLEALRAAAILHDQGHEFEMTIIGGVNSNEYLRQLQDFVRERDLASVVSIEPPTADPYSVMASHDICVVPSTNEPSSRVMVEAMLVGTVVVASDIGGNVEKAGGERDAAILYPLGDPAVLAERLAALLENPQRRREQADRGHAYASEMYLDKDQLAPLLAGLLEIAAQPARPSGTWIVDQLFERSAEHKRIRAAQHAVQQEKDDAVAGAQRTAQRTAELVAQVERLTAHVAHLEGLLTEYSTSRSWRMTEPARALGRGARRLIVGSAQKRGDG